MVLQDINQRVGDWLATGGNENDPYIEQQLRFAKHFLKNNPFNRKRGQDNETFEKKKD